MSIYYNNQIPGQLWLRDLTNNVTPAYNMLSSVFIKYQTINNSFFSDVSSNNINRFDVINDVLFLETNNGYIFEKFYVDEYSQIQPYNQMNLFNTRKNTTVDYWYSEPKKKIYFAEVFYNGISLNTNTFTFNVILKSFDCESGTASVILLKSINLAYLSANNFNEFLIENSKITYNSDTKTFNLSFILRNAVGSLGLLSVNILDIAIPQISQINGFLPYLTLDSANSSITNWTAQQYQDILTEKGEVIMTENYIELITS